MEKARIYQTLDRNEELQALPSEILEAYLEVTQYHYKLLERLAQR
jgi:hypothetical protein